MAPHRASLTGNDIVFKQVDGSIDCLRERHAKSGTFAFVPGCCLERTPVRIAASREAQGRYLRVVLLPDGETVHNAFYDRRYRP